MAEFHWDVRVYYEDTDAGGIVFYANYLKFFERARTEWLRAAGISQHALNEEQGRIFVVRSTAVDYMSPARLDERLRLSVVVEKLGRASVDFYQEAQRLEDGALLATGRIRVACVDAKTLRPAAIPAAVLEKISALRAQAGQNSLQD